MKNFYILIIALMCNSLFFNLSAQHAFERIYDDGGNENAGSVAEAEDGGYYLLTNSNNTGNFDIVLKRLDSDGSFLWSKNYGGDAYDFGKKILKLRDNNLLIVGSSNSFGGSLLDVYLIKISPQGDTIFTANINYNANDEVVDAIETSDGGFLVVGHSYISNGYNNGFVLKTNSQGKFEWSNNLLSSGNAYAGSCIETEEGNYLVLAGLYPQYNFDLSVVIYDQEGNLIDTRYYQSVLEDAAEGGISIDKWPGGGYLIGGIAGNYFYFNQFIIKLNKDLQLEKQIHHDFFTITGQAFKDYEIAFLNDTTIVAAGHKVMPEGHTELRTVILDTLLNEKSIKSYANPPASSLFYDLIIGSDESILVTGKTNAVDAFTGDAYFIKHYENTYITSKPYKKNSNPIKVSPIPASNVLYISSEADISGYAVFNSRGEDVSPKTLLAGNSELDISQLNQGIYIIYFQTLKNEFVEAIRFMKF